MNKQTAPHSQDGETMGSPAGIGGSGLLQAEPSSKPGRSQGPASQKSPKSKEPSGGPPGRTSRQTMTQDG